MSRGLTRHAFLRLAAAALPALAWPRAFASADTLDGEQRERIADVFRTYQLQGGHRTATDTDNDSGEWLAGEASRAGADVTPQQFEIDRVDLRGSFVESGGTRREALPFFDGGFTSADGVRGRLGAPGSGAPIALVTLDAAAISSEGTSIADLRRTAGIRAIVAVTAGGLPGLCPSNARDFGRPYGVPVLQVSSTSAPWLQAIAESGAPIRVVADAVRSRASATNIVATVRGRRPELAPVVVMTPRSGWWQCASERGGGLACWLEIMRAAASVRPDRTIRFVASSGHELGHAGLDRFLAREPALVRQAAAWLHLGANIGAAGGRTRLQTSSDEIEAIAMTSLDRSGARVDGRVPRGTVPAGEARNIHVGGGRYVSLLGSGPHFHNPDDLWPYSVDVDAVTRFAVGTTELALALARA
jgi:hypothetical protein